MLLVVLLHPMHFPQSTHRVVNMTLSQVFLPLPLLNGLGDQSSHLNGRVNPSWMSTSLRRSFLG